MSNIIHGIDNNAAGHSTQ